MYLKSETELLFVRIIHKIVTLHLSGVIFLNLLTSLLIHRFNHWLKSLERVVCAVCCMI